MAEHWSLEYLYRDAGNYKIYGTAYLAGSLTEHQREKLQSALIDGMYFIAEQAGLPSLRKKLVAQYGASIDDHYWHEWLELRPSTEEEQAVPTCITTSDLLHSLLK